MAGQAAFDAVFKDRLPQIQPEIAEPSGKPCALSWNPTAEEVMTPSASQDLRGELDSTKKRQMSLWEDLVLQADHAQAPGKQEPLHLEDKPRLLAIQDFDAVAEESQQIGEENLAMKNAANSPRDDAKLPDPVVDMVPDDDVKMPDDDVKMPDEGGKKPVADGGALPKRKERASDADDERLAKRGKSTFASKPPPKNEKLLMIWEAIVEAYDDLIKPFLVHPAKSEPSFYKFCRDKWEGVENMTKSDYYGEARFLSGKWLEQNKDAVPMKMPFRNK
jgi:hypothetical protein